MRTEAAVAALTVLGLYLALMGIGPEHTPTIASWPALGASAVCFGAAWTIVRRNLQ